MPRLIASRPVLRGVECAFRSRAAVEVLLSAGFPGLCAKRSGRGVFVDFIVLVDVYTMLGLDVCATFCWVMGIRERVAEGRRNDGGSMPQPRAVLGGIVDLAVWKIELEHVDVWPWRFSEVSLDHHNHTKLTAARPFTSNL